MIDFNALRQNRGQNAQALQRSLEKTENKGFDDPRIWKPTRSPENISVNVIRLLPIPKVDMEQAGQEGKWAAEDCTPSVKILKHGFQGVKGWLHANSPQTFGEDDPISEWSRPQWAAMKDANKEDPIIKAKRETLKAYIPKTEYYTNILVKHDAQKPENNGKVFLYKYGEAVRAFIDTAPNPKFPTSPKFDPFCPWEGADINLNLAYEKKTFKGKESWVPEMKAVQWAPNAPLGDDAEIERVWGLQYSLMEFLDRSKFPSYDDLKAKFIKVMNFDENFNPLAAGASIGKTAGQFLDTKASAPAPTTPSTPATGTPASAPAPVTAASTTTAPAATAEDELEALERLLNG